MAFLFLGIVLPGTIAVITALAIINKPRKRVGGHHTAEVSEHHH